jgi:hypothetical protein
MRRASCTRLTCRSDDAGQYLHRQAVRRLKADGIYNLKEKFGGKLVRLWTEWRHTGYTAERGFVALRAMKTMTSRVLADRQRGLDSTIK